VVALRPSLYGAVAADGKYSLIYPLYADDAASRKALAWKRPTCKVYLRDRKKGRTTVIEYW
jgi:hypothetical protein